MTFESLIGPVIKALWEALNRSSKYKLKKNAKKALTEAIGELVKLNPDLDHAEASIAIAKAAGIINADLFRAEKMLLKAKEPTGKVARVGFGSFSVAKKSMGGRHLRTGKAIKVSAKEVIKSKPVKKISKKTK